MILSFYDILQKGTLLKEMHILGIHQTVSQHLQLDLILS
jgi:hypothetical protein